jgi:ribose transport system substrate-binding protein
MKKMRIALAIALAAFVTGSLFAGGGQQAAGSSTVWATGTSAVSERDGKSYTADSFGYKPVANNTGKTFRIATIAIQNNPFWNDVTMGAYAAKAVLGLDAYKCQVDYKFAPQFDGQTFADMIDTCVTMKYDAICTVGVADSIVPNINKAVEAGIPVYTFNSDTATASKRIAFVGQDLYGAGVKLGESLVKLTGGQGPVAIITGLFTVNAHELRRQGAEEAFNKAGVKFLPAVENNDSADTAYTQTKDFVTANPDLKGILVTAGGPHGAARALDELGLANKINLVCFDATDEIIAYVRTGVIKDTLTQDPFGQGSDPLILAYNQLVTGKPEKTGNAFTKMDEITPANVNQFYPQ